MYANAPSSSMICFSTCSTFKTNPSLPIVLLSVKTAYIPHYSVELSIKASTYCARSFPHSAHRPFITIG